MRTLCLSLFLFAACGTRAADPPVPDPVLAPAPALVPDHVLDLDPDAIPHRDPAPVRPIAIDTHADTPQRMLDSGDDISQRLPDGHLDLPRMREGYLTAAFFSIWVDPRRFPGEEAWRRAQALSRAIRDFAIAHPREVVLATRAEDVRAAHRTDRIAILISIEGAHALGSAEPEVLLERLRQMHALGARSMTITWTNDNLFGHASTGAHPTRGLTALGRRAVAEMNRLGMIVDVSHVSDRTAFDVLAVSTRPVLASHSAIRALADHPRNLPDDLIRAIAARGGAVCINYYTHFLDPAYANARRALERDHAADFAHLEGRSWQTARERNAIARRLAPDLRPPSIEILGAHFAHAVELAGSEHVCLGSDFDGVSELAAGLEDVSDLPLLFAELERRGLPVPAIAGENVLRVLAAQSTP